MTILHTTRMHVSRIRDNRPLSVKDKIINTKVYRHIKQPQRIKAYVDVSVDINRRSVQYVVHYLPMLYHNFAITADIHLACYVYI